MAIVRFILSLAELALFAYWLIPMVYAPFKTHVVYSYLDRIFTPILGWLRNLIAKHLPAKYMLFDWSYLALFLLINILQWIL